MGEEQGFNKKKKHSIYVYQCSYLNFSSLNFVFFKIRQYAIRERTKKVKFYLMRHEIYSAYFFVQSANKPQEKRSIICMSTLAIGEGVE